MFRRRTRSRVSSAILACWVLQLATSSGAAPSPRQPAASVARLRLGSPLQSAVAPRHALRWTVDGMRPDAIYGISVAFTQPSALSPAGGGAMAELRLDGPGHEPIRKTLHAGDSEFYFNYQPRQAGPVTLALAATGAQSHPFRLEVRRLPARPADFPAIEREPNDRWQDANPITLGRTVWAGADDLDYLGPAQQIDTVAWPTNPETAGFDWYRFEYRAPQPALAQFNVELLDRDVPVNAKVLRQEKAGAEPVEYTEGKDPDEIRHDMQIELNYKHITRVVRAGTYYVQVAGRHPFYQLKTKLYPAPPYQDARQAVRTASDYILNTGDSWFAHTPRAGSVKFRLQNVSDETERCVACHPSQFSTRAAMIAFQNGYDVEQRAQLRYLIERFYNAAVPFYNHPGAYWTRFDLAPNNNLSRTADIVRMFEEGISHRPTAMLEHAAGFIRLSWRDRTELPKEEFDGNLAISSYKIAVDAWHVFDALYRRAHHDDDRNMRDHIRSLILTTKPKDCQELCDQTIALAMMDRAGFRDALAKNVEEIRRYQHDDGGWVRGFDEPKSVTSLQFMTGEGIYALTLAGVPHSDAAIRRAEGRLLSLQQGFGGWLDQKGEPFLTPFLETKWAIRALSELYHGPGKANGWNSTAARVRPVGPDNMVATLEDLDRAWDPPAPAVQHTIRALTADPEPMVRQAALMAIGRWERRSAPAEDVRVVAARLGDPVKMVWRAAAWSLRQLGNQGYGLAAIRIALVSEDARVRRGAARVFAQFFTPMAEHKEIARRLAAMAGGDPDFLVRVEAVKASWRWFYRTDDLALKATIADALIGRLAAEAPEAERINLTQALHNILDDNVRLFVEDWQPRLMTDGERAVSQAGWDATQRMLVERLTRALTAGNARQREGVLRQFGYNFLRPRIGNDLEMPTFTAPGNAQPFLLALRPFLEDTTPQIRVWATQAAAAGPAGETEAVVRSLVRGLRDSEKQVREVAQQTLGRYTVAAPIAAAVQPELLALLGGADEEARQGALTAILTHPTLRTRPMVEPILAAYAHTTQPRVREECLRNMSWIYDSHGDARALAILREASADAAMQTAVIEALRASATRSGPLHTQEAAIAMLQRFAAAESADVRVIALDVLRRSTTLRTDARILPILRAAVQDPLPRVRLAAVRQLAPFLKNAAAKPVAQASIRLALADADEPTRTEAATALGVPVPQVTAQAAAKAAEAAKLDYDYFLARVQPIFVKQAGDGAACYSCHSTHALLRIAQPDKDGRLTPEQLRQNYESTLKVIDLQFPEQSLILRKPLSPTENPPPGGITHSGGPRWPRGADSDEYRVLLAWIKGARLEKGAQQAAR